MGARFLVLFVVALQLVQCCDHSGGNEGERVWAAGGRAEFAARGKCWIDGECESGGKWWQGSQDDEEEAYRTKHVGVHEAACLNRAREYHESCGNRADQRILATFVPKRSSRFYPEVQEGTAEAELAWEEVWEMRKIHCWYVGEKEERDQAEHSASCSRQDADGRCAKQGRGWEFNTLMGLEDFELLSEEIEVLRDMGYCLNQDAVYKWAVVLKSLKLLQSHTLSSIQEQGQEEASAEEEEEKEEGEEAVVAAENLTCVDIGGGSAPLQYLMAQQGCNVLNIDINFLSSWFPVDDRGLYLRSDPRFVPLSPKKIRKAEGDFLSQLRQLPSGSVDVFYDACSFIHMWSRYPSPQDGLSTAMYEVYRCLKPGGVVISASDVSHPDAQEIREFLHPHTLANVLSHNGQLEWLSEPRFYLREGRDEEVLGAAEQCLQLSTSWHKPNMSSHPLSAASLHTCEPLPEGELRLLVANFVLRKPPIASSFA